ncbi:hypothetical protein M513_10346, partial [Trichuris suis]
MELSVHLLPREEMTKRGRQSAVIYSSAFFHRTSSSSSSVGPLLSVGSPRTKNRCADTSLKQNTGGARLSRLHDKSLQMPTRRHFQRRREPKNDPSCQQWVWSSQRVGHLVPMSART